MDKTLAEYLFPDIENDQFLNSQFQELLIDYAKSIVIGKRTEYTNEYKSLLRYADVLSLSIYEKHQNISQQIVILLSHLFPNESEVEFFKRNIYKNVSNFASANILEKDKVPNEQLEVLRQLEIESHKISNNIPGTDKQFFDTQKIALNSLEKNQFYSFSAPTSMGKTFIITNFIRKKLKTGSHDNFAIIVPTKALLSEIANGIIKEFADLLGEGRHKVVTTMASVQKDENCIAILTPERLYYSLLKLPDYKFNCIFIDEAHKISDTDKRSIIYYKILDMLKMQEDISIYFSSPVIPNPDIYLELTNYYSQPDSSANGRAFVFSPVIQNKLYIDLSNSTFAIYNSFSKALIPCDTLPTTITDKISALLQLGKDKCNLIYVSSAKKAIEFAMQLCQVIPDDSITIEDKSALEFAAKQIEKKIHKEYYLAQLVRKRVAYHIGALPAEIRAQIEGLIRKGIIKYCFCTSTLLEGVNVPVDNLFIFDNKKARSKMSITDAFNLMGRAGRVTLNEYGNVYLIVEDKDVKKYYDDILLKPLPRQELLPSKAISKKNKKYIVQTLLSGRTNLLEIGDKYKDKGFTETTYEYSAKCLNILLHDICSNNDSYIVRDFKNDQALTPQNIIDIREIFGVITEKDDDINISARQKESLYKAVREQHLNYPSSIAYDTCVDFLKELSRILDWKIYEKDSLGKGEKIRYYAVILNQWMEGKGLHEIIRGAIKHYQTNGGSLVSYEPNYHLEKYNDSTQHKNQVINEVMKDIEQIINYKFSMYFLRLSEAIIEIHGEKALVNDWYEYVEYGTNNNSVIILQKYGFLREEALELLKPPLLDHIKFEKQRVIIKNSIMDIASQDLQDKIATIKINYPEIFSD